MELKEFRKKYQGKYFCGNEIFGRPTYMYLKKVLSKEDEPSDDYKCYVDVIFVNWNTNVYIYKEDTLWLAGESRMRIYNYSRIMKKDFYDAYEKYIRK